MHAFRLVLPVAGVRSDRIAVAIGEYCMIVGGGKESLRTMNVRSTRLGPMAVSFLFWCSELS